MTLLRGETPWLPHHLWQGHFPASRIARLIPVPTSHKLLQNSNALLRLPARYIRSQASLVRTTRTPPLRKALAPLLLATAPCPTDLYIRCRPSATHTPHPDTRRVSPANIRTEALPSLRQRMLRAHLQRRQCTIVQVRNSSPSQPPSTRRTLRRPRCWAQTIRWDARQHGSL